MSAEIEEIQEAWLIEHCSRYNDKQCGKMIPDHPLQCCNAASWESYRRRWRRVETKAKGETE